MEEVERKMIDKIVSDFNEKGFAFNELINAVREGLKKLYGKEVSFLELWQEISGAGVSEQNVRRIVERIFEKHRPKI